MAFDDLKLNRVSRRPGLSEPVASGERGTVYDAADGIMPRLRAVEAELEELRTRSAAVSKEMTRIVIAGAPTPGAPTEVAVTDQQLVVDERGQVMVEVTISWRGTADAYEIAIARRYD